VEGGYEAIKALPSTFSHTLKEPHNSYEACKARLSCHKVMVCVGGRVRLCVGGGGVMCSSSRMSVHGYNTKHSLGFWNNVWGNARQLKEQVGVPNADRHILAFWSSLSKLWSNPQSLSGYRAVCLVTQLCGATKTSARWFLCVCVCAGSASTMAGMALIPPPLCVTLARPNCVRQPWQGVMGAQSHSLCVLASMTLNMQASIKQEIASTAEDVVAALQHGGGSNVLKGSQMCVVQQ